MTPMDVTCAAPCNAPPGQRCRTKGGTLRKYPHEMRSRVMLRVIAAEGRAAEQARHQELHAKADAAERYLPAFLRSTT